jgi:type IV secretory pathway protease TraF
VLSTISVKPTTHYLWNASESAPVGLYLIQPTGRLFVTELLAVEPPEPLATFLADGRYLPRGIPMLKRVLALPGHSRRRSVPHELAVGGLAGWTILRGTANERDCWSGGTCLDS